MSVLAVSTAGAILAIIGLVLGVVVLGLVVVLFIRVVRPLFEIRRYALDILAEAADPEALKLQLDLGWVDHAGLDPVSYLRQFTGRVPTLHFKDMSADPQFMDTPLGDGRLPIPDLIAAAREAGTEWFIIEQDEPQGPPIEAVRRSAAYMRAQGVA